MSTTIYSPGAKAEPAANEESFRYTLESPDDFAYQPIPLQIPASLVAAVLGLSAFFSEWLLILPLAGMMLALSGLRKIRTGAGAYSGEKLGRLALTSSIGILVTAGTMHAYIIATEVPAGYHKLNFTTDVSQHPPMNVEGRMAIDPAVAAFDKSKVFIKGYMYPTKSVSNLDGFLLCKDSGDCCFGGNPKTSDMIWVEMPKGKRADFGTGLVAVGGEFELSPAATPDGLHPIYTIKATHFYNPAKTAY